MKYLLFLMNLSVIYFAKSSQNTNSYPKILAGTTSVIAGATAFHLSSKRMKKTSYLLHPTEVTIVSFMLVNIMTAYYNKEQEKCINYINLLVELTRNLEKIMTDISSFDAFVGFYLSQLNLSTIDDFKINDYRRQNKIFIGKDTKEATKIYKEMSKQLENNKLPIALFDELNEVYIYLSAFNELHMLNRNRAMINEIKVMQLVCKMLSSNIYVNSKIFDNYTKEIKVDIEKSSSKNTEDIMYISSTLDEENIEKTQDNLFNFYSTYFVKQNKNLKNIQEIKERIKKKMSTKERKEKLETLRNTSSQF